MKRIFMIVAIALLWGVLNAQNYEVFHIEDLINGYEYNYCADDVDGIIIHKAQNCPTGAVSWIVTGDNGVPVSYWTDSIVVGNSDYSYGVDYSGCSFVTGAVFNFHRSSDNINPFSEPYIWKHLGESTSITINVSGWLDILWSTGETGSTIEVTEPGTCSVTLSDVCGSETYSIQVRDNVEIELATCDLVTNLNMVTWQTTPAQAQYIDHVIVKRDGQQVGTANYSEGSFLDNIGSDLAQRTYTLTAVATDGTECPIVSYPKETIHMAYLTGVNNTIEVNWNTPTGYDLLGYNICEWTPNGKDGDLRVIDFVGASVTSYTCQASQFTSGYVIIQGVEASKPESRLLSNRSSETVDVGEYGMEGFKVYPNPASGAFTVEGMGYLTVLNLLGQEILAQEVEGKTTLELPKGIYLMRLGSANRKIVVE